MLGRRLALVLAAFLLAGCDGGLLPPRSVAVSYRRLLATFDKENLDVHLLRDAVDARSLPRIKRLSKLLRALEKRFDLRASRLGLRTCAKL